MRIGWEGNTGARKEGDKCMKGIHERKLARDEDKKETIFLH
jgi:hypothetical protein